MIEQKKVFISYRRAPARYFARAIYQDLRAHDYDVFLDVDSIDSGDFDKIILRQIPARAHFIFILTPGTLDRCKNPGDWVLRELEEAINTGRNIIPLITEEFDWGDIGKYLPEEIGKTLSKKNAVKVYHDYFDAAMERLRTRHLKKPEYDNIEEVETPPEDKAEVEKRIESASSKPVVTGNELSAEEYFRQGYNLYQDDKFHEAINKYTRAIDLNPFYVHAYNNRGLVKYKLGDDTEAIADYSRAIKLDPDDATFYNNRGIVKAHLKDYEGAIADFDKALDIDPEHELAQWNRSLAIRLRDKQS